MRVLATFAGGTGHFLPTLPYARQLQARGHQVRYACQPAMVPVVEAAGFPAVDTRGGNLLPPDERRPLAPVDRAHEQRVVADFFITTVGTERAARTTKLIDRWRPDLVLRDEIDVGAGVAAEAAGVPSADVPPETDAVPPRTHWSGSSPSTGLGVRTASATPTPDDL